MSRGSSRRSRAAAFVASRVCESNPWKEFWCLMPFVDRSGWLAVMGLPS